MAPIIDQITRPCHASRPHPRPRRRPSRRPRRLPARLPRHLRDAGDGRGRARRRDPRRARSPADRRRAVHQGRPLPRAHVLRRTVAASDEAHRPQGRGPLRTHLVGRSARHHRGETRRDRRVGRRTRGDPAVQLRRQHGADPVRLDGPALLPSPGRLAAGPDDLRDRGQGRMGQRRRRRDGHGHRAGRRQPADRDLGQQFGHVEPALLDPRAGGQAARRPTRRDRPVPHRDRRQMPRAPRSAARDRRGACLRNHARADPRRPRRPRLRRAAHAGLRCAGGARGGVPAGEGRGDLRPRRRAGRAPGPGLRHARARGDPRQLRPAAHPGRRQRRAGDRLPARADGRVARIRPAARC